MKNLFITLFSFLLTFQTALYSQSQKDHQGSFEKQNLIVKTGKENLKCADYHAMRRGIKNSFIKFEREKRGKVAFLGGSITYNPGWRDSICQYLKNRFPDTKFEFIAAGIPSFGSTENAFRMQRDILKNGPVDLLFVEAAVNDAGKGRPDKEILRAMEGIVRHAEYADPATDIVFMYFVDPGKIEKYNAGKIPKIIKLHDSIARYYELPALNLAKEVTDRINHGEFTWKGDFRNLHPSPFGQGIYARSMIGFLEKSFSGIIENNEKVEDHPLPPELDPYCYDNGVLVEAKEIKRTKGWKFVKRWKPAINARTRPNYIKVPMLTGSYPSEAIKFTFKGNAAGIAVAAGPNAGIVEYRIDNGDWKTRDLFTRHSNLYYLPWYYVLQDELPEGKHTLELKLSDKKNPASQGNKCVIRYFFYNKTE